MNRVRRPKFRKFTLVVVLLTFWFAQVHSALACMVMDMSWVDACTMEDATPGAQTSKTSTDCCDLNYEPGALAEDAAAPAKVSFKNLNAEPPVPAILSYIPAGQWFLVSTIVLSSYLPAPPPAAGAGIVLNTLRLRI